MPRSFAFLAALTALGAAVSASGSAQSAAGHVAAGDKAYAKRNAPEALHHYLEAIAADSTNAAALTRASRTEAELAEFDPDTAHRLTLLESAERHGRAAIAKAPRDADAHFALAQALGRHALLLPVTDRLPYAVEIHKEATACLDLAPKHPGCLHVLALWNAEYMRLGYFSRELANTMTGRKLFANASWAEAERNLLAAIAIEPKRAIHHLDLARIYLDQGKSVDARKELEAVMSVPVRDFNDPQYKAEAKRMLAGDPSP